MTVVSVRTRDFCPTSIINGPDPFRPCLLATHSLHLYLSPRGASSLLRSLGSFGTQSRPRRFADVARRPEHEPRKTSAHTPPATPSLSTYRQSLVRFASRGDTHTGGPDTSVKFCSGGTGGRSVPSSFSLQWGRGLGPGGFVLFRFGTGDTHKKEICGMTRQCLVDFLSYLFHKFYSRIVLQGRLLSY